MSWRQRPPFPPHGNVSGLAGKLAATFPMDNLTFNTLNGAFPDKYGNRVGVVVSGGIYVNPVPPGPLPSSLYAFLNNRSVSTNAGLQYNTGTVTGNYSRFTTMLWFYLNSLPAGGAFYALSAQDTSTNGFGFLIGGTSQKLELWTAAGSFTGTTGTTVLSTATWYHAAALYDGTNRTFYLNGAQEGTAAASFTATTTNGWGIGQDPANTTRSLDGYTADPRFFSRALNVEEINSIMLSAYLPEEEELAPPWAIPVAPPPVTFSPGWVNANTAVQGVAT